MEDEYGVEHRTARRSTTYRSKPRTEYVSNEEELVGLYRFVRPYPLFKKPEEYVYAQRFYPADDNAPMAIATGKVFLVNGTKIAYEVITTHNGHSMICWTTSSSLEFVTSATEEP